LVELDDMIFIISKNAYENCFTGAATLSIDDGHPDKRVSKIISQGQPALVIVENEG